MNNPIYRCCIFPNGCVWFLGNLLCICHVWKVWLYTDIKVSVSSIFSNSQFYLKYYFLFHRTNAPLLEEIQLSINSMYLFSIFIQQNMEITIVVYIYSILEERTEADVSETSSRHHFWAYFFKMLYGIMI